MNAPRQDLYLLLRVVILIVLAVIVVGWMISCAGAPTGRGNRLTVSAKDGESCLVTHQCKLLMVRDEDDINSSWRQGHSSWRQGHVYYHCLVSDEFYRIVKENEEVIMAMKQCEKVNP